MSTPILIDPGSRFQCVPDCGFCCGFWDISIDKQRKAALLEKDWVQKMERDLEARKHQTLFKILGQDEIIQRQNGTCSFINERKLCSIHAVEGYDAKPLGCQQYPYIYYQTPRGLEVLLDHSCPEVIQNLGDPVTIEEVERRLPREHVLTIVPAFPLDSKTSLDWRGYAEMEDSFRRVLGCHLSYEEKILCLDQIVKELSLRLSGKTTSDGEVVKEALTDIQAGELEKILSKIKALSPNHSKRELYLAILIQCVEASYAGRISEKPVSSGKMVMNILKQWKGIGEKSFEVFKFRVTYTQMKDVGFYAQLETFRSTVDRYLYYLIRTLVSTGTMPISKRLAIIATNFSLVKWFSRAYAASNARAQVTLQDVVFAIRVVEKFMSNRLFNELAVQKDFIANVINFLFENATLPGTMLSES
jgi:Fe-S-cluster containining protein